nr:energy transducer TonB [Acidobacteriota bacterium]
VYKYDERGNISEMTLHAPDGSLIGKETYTYEFDLVGNWTKMTTSVAVIEGGKVNFEPTEVTYRTITYYLNANMAKMVQPASTTTPPAPSSAPAAKPNTDPKTEPKIAAAATNGNHATASVKTQAASLPVANTLDKTNIVPVSNRGGSIPGGAVGTPASSNSSGGVAIVKVEDAGEPPVKPLPKPLTKPVSGGILNGKATELPKPEYPELAKRAHAGGMVSVEVVIDETGKIISARAVSGPPLLREAAVKAALRARFSPTKLSGQPVKISGLINYNFSFN